MHPTGNEDVRPHVERGYLLKYGGSPNFHFETSYSERRPLTSLEVTQKTNFRLRMLAKLRILGYFFRLFKVLGS